MANEDMEEQVGDVAPMLDDDDDDEGKKPSKPFSIIIGVLIAAIWIAVLCVLIKLDVGGFGSKVLAPVFKDVPIINKILPDTTDEELIASEEYPYSSLAEAISYIKELELKLDQYESREAVKDDTIKELESEVSRLKSFEDNQLVYETIREKFYTDVVFGDKAVDVSNYKEYYESIEPEIAEKIYKQVVEKMALDEQYQTFANTFSEMDPKSAASILNEMSGNLETVVGILNAIETENRAQIMEALAKIDPVYAAKVTQLLVP